MLDRGLPDGDRLEVLLELRRSQRHVPVILLTARDAVADTVAALDQGADDYMTKPFSFDELRPGCAPGCAPTARPRRTPR